MFPWLIDWITFLVVMATTMFLPPCLSPTSLTKDEWDICEAVFRYQFVNNRSAAKQKAEAYYLQIKRMDVPSEFLVRFGDNTPPIKNGSQFRQGKGVLLFISQIKHRTEDRVEVEGGHDENWLSASYVKFYVLRNSGKWEVVGERLEMIATVFDVSATKFTKPRYQ